VRSSGKNVRRIISAVVAASVWSFLAAPGANATALGRGHHDGRERHASVRGVDVSHYQGAIDWPAVARDHVAFAYIKATEGVGGRDEQFARNWRGAQRAGLRVGAYHYFIFCRSARAQARNFLAVAPRRAGGLPPAVDLEPAHSCPARLTGPEVRKQLAVYLAAVEARDGKRAVLYVTPQFFSAYRHYLPRRPLWRRSIAAKSAPDGSSFWQYRSRGRVAGIRTAVDLNVLSHGKSAAAL
jgi:lysozyme